MEISPASAAPATSPYEAIRALPSSGDAAVASRRAGDTFRPSLRTPLDADRILADRGEAVESVTILGSGGSTADDPDATKTAPSASGSDDGTSSTDSGTGTLDPDEREAVETLKQVDRDVRAHEQAHLSAAGGMARGGASFTYDRGPDGKSYAVAGEVRISLRQGRTPEETIRNAEQARAAALAPADPSPTDRSTAAAAARLAQEARTQKSQARDGSGTANPAQGADASGTDSASP